MARNQKKEEVSVSFHSLVRKRKTEEDELEDVEINLEEFKAIVAEIRDRPKSDMSDKQVLRRLQFRQEVSLENSMVINGRTLFGVYRAPYTGHSFDNSAKGKIPADSVNLRPFHYILYLSTSGKIYLGSQYLGHYGAYAAISGTIRSMMNDPGSVHSHTFRLDAANYQNAVAKEVKVTFSKKPDAIAAKNLFGSGGMIAVKKKTKDDGFEQEVAKCLWPLIGGDQRMVKKELARLLSENELFEVSDEDIEDCTVLAKINGRTKTIYMLDTGNFATKFPINVPLNDDGHPVYENVQKEMLELLKEQIISQNEHV